MNRSLFPLLLFVGLAASASSTIPRTPREVWADFDPRVEPLEIEVLKRWTKGGADFTEFYFTGMTNGPEKVRVYAIYSAPSHGTNLPGILHIHGGGQTVNQEWLRFWNQRGYAALTFNWGGHWTNREKYALWGSLTQGNHADARGMMEATEPSVRMSSWYLWTRVARRALTALERQPEVDPNRLGIFGVSMGGTITWPFAGMDKRVKAACAVYGVGWLTFPDELNAPDPRATETSTKVWRVTMASEAYAPLVKCPLLFLDASNDFYGKMDWAFRTLSRVPAECRWSFTPRHNHHIAAGQEHNLPLWMDTWVKKGGPAWPKTPQARVTLDPQGIPQLIVTADSSTPIRQVDFYYALENHNPKTRFWRTAMAKAAGRRWTASLPVMDPDQPLFAFANVSYVSGVCLGSPLVTTVPSRLGRAKATDTPSLLIDDFSEGTGDWVALLSGPDPIPPVTCLLTNGLGSDGRRGVTVTRATPLVTHKPGDPKWRGPDGAALEFKVYAPMARDLKIGLHENFRSPGAKEFMLRRQLKASPKWQTVSAAAGEFKTADGEPLPNWRRVQLLELSALGDSGPQPLYTDFRWRP